MRVVLLPAEAGAAAGPVAAAVVGLGLEPEAQESGREAPGWLKAPALGTHTKQPLESRPTRTREAWSPPVEVEGLYSCPVKPV